MFSHPNFDCHFSSIVGYIQPELLKARFDKGDSDGFLDRHWVTLTTRKKTYFKDIGEIAGDEYDLGKLFIEVHKRHHTNSEVFGIDIIIGYLVFSYEVD